ncbi:hypothetical protein GCM10020227_13890 [Streptomyces flavovirens]
MSPSEKLKTTLAESKKRRQQRPWPSAGQLDQWVSCSEFLYLVKAVRWRGPRALRPGGAAARSCLRPAGDGPASPGAHSQDSEPPGALPQTPAFSLRGRGRVKVRLRRGVGS